MRGGGRRRGRRLRGVAATAVRGRPGGRSRRCRRPGRGRGGAQRGHASPERAVDSMRHLKKGSIYCYLYFWKTKVELFLAWSPNVI